MGNLCASCCNPSNSYEDITPDVETRRQQQVEAAEKRLAEQEHRGIKNIESLRRQQRLDEARERRQEEAAAAGNNQGGLKWQVN